MDTPIKITPVADCKFECTILTMESILHNPIKLTLKIKNLGGCDSWTLKAVKAVTRVLEGKPLSAEEVAVFNTLLAQLPPEGL